MYFGVFLIASALLASMVAAVFAMAFALKTESEDIVFVGLEPSQTENLLYGLCGGLAAAVLILIGASVLKLVGPIITSLVQSVRSMPPSDKR